MSASNIFEGGLFGLSKNRSDMLKNLSEANNNASHDEIAYSKQIILEDLYKDNDLLLVLNNPELEGCPAEDYRNVNIFSYIKIPETQSKVKNFVCFEVNEREPVRHNDIMITRQIVFRTVSHEDDVETPWGIDRQDLLAMIIKDRFCWSNCLGLHLKKTYDAGKIAENGYYYRDMYFEAISTNGLNKATRNNVLDNKLDRGLYDARRFD